MKQSSKAFPSLAEIEREVMTECREWGRQRLEERLQKLADEQGEVFPPQATSAAKVDAAKRVRRGKARR